MKRIVLLLWLIGCSLQPAFGQSVTLPETITGIPGQWIVVAPVKTDGGTVKWRLDSGLQEVHLGQLLPEEYVAKLKGKVVTATRPGKYRVEAWNAKGDVASEIATAWIVIGGEPIPVPVPPVPVPPAPDPVPFPPSPLQKALKAAYDAELDADKAAKVAKFADILDGATAAARGKVKTAKDFTTGVHAATDLAIGAASIPTVRRAVGAYLVTVLPTAANTPADDAYFEKVASEHGYVAQVLRGLR